MGFDYYLLMTIVLGSFFVFSLCSLLYNWMFCWEGVGLDKIGCLTAYGCVEYVSFVLHQFKQLQQEQ